MSKKQIEFKRRKTMSKELRQLYADLNAKQVEANTLMTKEGVTKDELNAKLGEVQTLQAKVDMQKAIDGGKTFDENGVELTGSDAKDQSDRKNESKATYQSAFMNALRRKATNEDCKILNALNPNTNDGADGGLLIPQDIQTAINQYKRDLPQLEALINVVPVGTSSGSRVFEKIATMTALTNITDLTADIADMGNPTFENVTYAIKDYAGYMPVPNDLLNDSDQNIMAYLTQWIARKSVVTRNSLILSILTGLTPTTFADYKAIKKALNVTLDPMLATGAIIVTNQDGFQYLDTLEDGNGRPILQTDVTQPSRKLFAGKPVEVISNSVLATTGTSTKLAPMFVGNLLEAITLFERQGHQVASTNVGGTAFQKNRTEIRVIEREDIKAIDTSAVIYGKIDVTSVLA